MKRLSVLAVLAIGLAFAACGNNENTNDDGNPADVVDTDVPATDVQEDVVPDTSIDSIAPDTTPEDQGNDPGPYVDGALAKIAETADLIGGPNATAVAGDVLIRNSHVRFMVRNQEHGLYSPYGGSVVDADIVRPEGHNNSEKFHELVAMTGFARLFHPTSMTIVDDGSHSGTAVVRFAGTDGGMALIDSVLPTFALGLNVTVDYVLGPDDRALTIRTTIKDPNNSGVPIDVGQLLMFGNRGVDFFDRCGTNVECLGGKNNLRWLASAAGDVSYAATVPGDKNVSLLLEMNELLILSGGALEIPKGAEAVTTSYLAVGEGTIDNVLDTVWELRGEEQGEEVTIKVNLSDPTTERTKLLIRAKISGETDKNGWVTATTPVDEGDAVMHLAPGTYDLTLSIPGSPDTVLTGVEVTADGENAFEMNPQEPGWVHAVVTNGDDAPITAAITFQGGHDAPWTTGVSRYDVVRNGDQYIAMLPGNYTATVSKGVAYGIDRKNVTVTAGQVAELTATVDEVIDTTGFIMMNSHEHCERSVDSAVFPIDRIYNAIANGIEMMNPSDHDFLGTHQPMIEAYGLDDQIASARSLEVSPVWGHTTAGDCAIEQDYATYFLLNYTLYNEMGAAERAMTATEIYNQARNILQCSFLAINHPYRGGPTFETYGILADTNPEIALPDLDIRLVDALEVINKDDSLTNILTENIPAWFNLLNRGYNIAGIGGSDEHHYRGNYGNPRNMVASATDNPGELDPTTVFQSVKDFHSLVMGGPMIRLTADGLGMGDVVPAGETVDVHVVVEAPVWMGLNFCRVYANGELIGEFVPGARENVIRVDEHITFTPTSDAWIVALAGSDLPEHEMTPVGDKQPLSITNPVFIDADSNGYEAIYANGAPWDEE